MPAHQNASVFDVQYMCAGARARRCWPSYPRFTPAAIYLLFILPFGTKAASLALLFVKTHQFPMIPSTLLPTIPALNPLLPFSGNPSISLASSTSRGRYVIFPLFSGATWFSSWAAVCWGARRSHSASSTKLQTRRARSRHLSTSLRVSCWQVYQVKQSEALLQNTSLIFNSLHSPARSPVSALWNSGGRCNMCAARRQSRSGFLVRPLKQGSVPDRVLFTPFEGNATNSYVCLFFKNWKLQLNYKQRNQWRVCGRTEDVL